VAGAKPLRGTIVLPGALTQAQPYPVDASSFRFEESDAILPSVASYYGACVRALTNSH
jgi:hypothetical protein